MGRIFSGGAAGGTCVGNIESGGRIFYGGSSGGTCVGHAEGGIIFTGGASGGTCIGNVDSGGIVFAGGASGGNCVGHIEGNVIFAGGASGGTCIGHVEGGDELIGGAALLLGLLNASSNTSYSQSTSYSSDSGKKGNPLWVFITHPIGNIVLGLFIAIAINIFSGGWYANAGIPVILGIVITAIGVLRLILRIRKNTRAANVHGNPMLIGLWEEDVERLGEDYDGGDYVIIRLENKNYHMYARDDTDGMKGTYIVEGDKIYFAVPGESAAVYSYILDGNSLKLINADSKLTLIRKG